MTVSGGNWAAETANDLWYPQTSAVPLEEGQRTEAASWEDVAVVLWAMVQDLVCRTRHMTPPNKQTASHSIDPFLEISALNWLK